MYASHADACLYSYYASKISKKYEKLIRGLNIDNHILAYRRISGKCNIDFARDVFSSIAKRKQCCALAFDISKFFDMINHAMLKQELAYTIGETTLPIDYYKVFRSLTKFSSANKDLLLKLLGISKHNIKGRRLCNINDFRDKVRTSGLIETHKEVFGIPQGSPLSGLLSNIALLNFDVQLSAAARKRQALYYRYSDDILVVCECKDADYFNSLVEDALAKLNLKTNNKTKRHYFSTAYGRLVADTPLQYLGFMFDGTNVSIRSSSLIRFQAKISRRISQAIKSRDKHNKVRANTGQKPRELFKQSLLSSSTHLGKRNFIRYGLRASSIFASPVIRRQIARLGRQFFGALKEKA